MCIVVCVACVSQAPPAGSTVRRKPKPQPSEVVPPEPVPHTDSTPADVPPTKQRVRKPKIAADASALVQPLGNMSMSDVHSAPTPEGDAPPVRRIRKKKPALIEGEAPSSLPVDVPPAPPEPTAGTEGIVRTKSRKKMMAAPVNVAPEMPASAVVSEPVRRKKAAPSAGVDVDPRFAEENWDDEATDSKLNDSRAKSNNGGKVAVQPQFVLTALS